MATPMMQQYLEIKAQNPDSILFFRLGDFYEMFYDDAKTVSGELDLTLTGKDCGEAERAPMCGIPFHSADSYISRLVSRGYKVVICEQTEDPALAKGLVKREVIRIITPGTVIENNMLSETQNNYLCAVCVSGGDFNADDKNGEGGKSGGENAFDTESLFDSGISGNAADINADNGFYAPAKAPKAAKARKNAKRSNGEAITFGVAFADVSTGDISVTSFKAFGEEGRTKLINELSVFSPREILFSEDASLYPELAEYVSRQRVFFRQKETALFDFEAAEKAVLKQFPQIAAASGSASEANPEADFAATAETDFAASSAASEADFASETELVLDDEVYAGIGCKKLTEIEKTAVGALLIYISDTQKTDISYIKKLSVYHEGQFMELDANTRRNLELCETLRTKEKRGTLLWVLDRTKTSMGARQIRKWVEQPLINPNIISARQDAVAELVLDVMLRGELTGCLSGIIDIERVITKIVYGTANARDLSAIAAGLSKIPEIKKILSKAKSRELKAVCSGLDGLSDVCALIRDAICDEPPFTVREGGMIRKGYNADVDHLLDIKTNGKNIITRIESSERAKTGIKNLKVGYNRVFGYYIEVSRSNTAEVPPEYIRKQTLTSGERYITDELKRIEAEILGATERLTALEYELFTEVRNKVAAANGRIARTASMIAKLDAYISLADTAARNNYTRPEVTLRDCVRIKDGRHPIVEQFVKDGFFVPNDTELDTKNNRLMIITGPNMAGKSTYMRQVALITLMAQIGSFVPAREAEIGVCDKIFTRVGASDDLASGQSTFMLEMTEVAAILKNATRRSLIIYDEIGRGTSTFDGMSIARAVAEYTAGSRIGAKTLFATHYHELTELENSVDGIVNYNIAAKKKGDDITFLRRIVRGSADDSYGIEVAKLAGVPNDVIRRAKEVLKELEAKSKAVTMQTVEENIEAADANVSFDDMRADEIVSKIKNIDINMMTPLDALNLVYELKKMAD